MHAYGAGGASGSIIHWGNYYFAGGSGGYTTGTISVSAGQIYYIAVGQGGAEVTNPSYNTNIGGGGGGMSGVFTSASFSSDAAVAVAGGGGGGGSCRSTPIDNPMTGGPGGGLNGSPAGSGGNAQGGTQTSGGVRGTACTQSGTPGTSMAGGAPPTSAAALNFGGGAFSSALKWSGGGGGGGYFGGGGGAYCEPNQMSGGGGGSSFVGVMASASTTPGNYPIQLGNASLCPTIAGVPYYIAPLCNGGGLSDGVAGEHGLVVVIPQP